MACSASIWAGPQRVTAANPHYARFLEAQIARHGRYHPIVASEYFLEPLDGGGGLFPPRRVALMRGKHGRQRLPGGAGPFVALLDVGGQEEAATSALARLANPARDYTVCTIVRLVAGADEQEARYHALDVFVDQGSRLFESAGGREPLAERLLAYLESWPAAHLVADATGVGEGLVAWLAARLGERQVTPFKFTRSSKAALGAAFLAILETGRFHYWTEDAQEMGSDGWWFWQQALHCLYELPPGGTLERDLRWGVPAAARVATPQGRLPVHDDRLISAALVAEVDRLLREKKLFLGEAKSAVLAPRDPLDKMGY